MARYKVLSTKKLEPSLIKKAEENDIEIIEQEFISIKPIWDQQTLDKIISLADRGVSAIAFTSANAVDSLNSYMHAGDTYHGIRWSIFCLSGKTKEAVSNALLLIKNIAGEAEDAAGLANKIIKQEVREIIFFCGNKRREELPAALKAADVKVHEIVLYETIETPLVIKDHFDAVLFFSPSGVQSFFASNEPPPDTICFAIGRTTATSIATFTNNTIIKSPVPDPKKMVEEVIEHFKQKSAVN